MNTLFDLDALETKSTAPNAPKPDAPKFYIEVLRDGQRAALVERHSDSVTFMVIDTTRKQRQPHLYKTLSGARNAALFLKDATVKRWTGRYED